MDRRRMWWNGKWGRIARRDVLLYSDGATWWVEAREGGAEGRSRWFEHAEEAAALRCVDDHLVGPDRWRELA